MKWAGRRDPPEGDMTPPEETPSSPGQGARGSSEWSSITRPSGIVTLHKRYEKKQNNMSDQIISREAHKLWRLLLY